jgi:hypothetical protein
MLVNFGMVRSVGMDDRKEEAICTAKIYDFVYKPGVRDGSALLLTYSFSCLYQTRIMSEVCHPYVDSVHELDSISFVVNRVTSMTV